MKKLLLPALALALALPGLAMAKTPVVGDMLGKTPQDLTAALTAAGMTVDKIDAEDGMVEAKVHDAAGQAWEIYVDTATGVVAKVKQDE